MPIYQDFVGLNTLGIDNFLIKADDRTSVNATHIATSTNSTISGPASWFPTNLDVFSCSMWVKFDKNSNTDTRSVFAIQDGSGNFLASVRYYYSSSAWKIELRINKSDGTATDYIFLWNQASTNIGDYALPNQFYEWGMLSFTVDRSRAVSSNGEKARLFINGEFINVIPTTTTNDITNTSATMYLLQDQTPNPMQGSVHNLSLWQRCLTNEEIKKLYNRGKVLTYDRIPEDLKRGMIEHIPLGDEVLPLWGKKDHKYSYTAGIQSYSLLAFKGKITQTNYNIAPGADGLKSVLHEKALLVGDPNRVSRIAQNTLGLSHDLIYYKNPRASDHWDAAFNWQLPRPTDWRYPPGSWTAGSDTTVSPLQFNALVIKRNGPYGWPLWKQIRSAENPLTRLQKQNNIFTFVIEPGDSRITTINSKNIYQTDRFSPIRSFYEPPVSDRSKPLTLIGGIKVYNQRTNSYNVKNIQIKTSFGNETDFFANEELNNVYGTIEETDDNYENFKELYLDDGLESDASPIERFNLMIYKQTVWPKMENAYLNRTRSRTHFVNKFWRNKRVDRNQLSASNGFDIDVPHQSMFPLDAASDWSSREEPPQAYFPPTVLFGMGVSEINFAYYVGGDYGVNGRNFGTGERPYFSGSEISGYGAYYFLGSTGSSGVLMNTYSHIACGYYYYDAAATEKVSVPYLTGGILSLFGNTTGLTAGNLTASCFYSRRHTLNPQASLVSPSGMNIQEIVRTQRITTGSLFMGNANWDAPAQSGKTPFYDSYDDFAADTRVKGKGYSIVPEFRISSHVKTYQSKGVTEELFNIYELSGAASEDTTTQEMPSFYKVLSNSDFLQHFDMIKQDHEDFAKPALITLRCKAIKKFLPYEGFYPAQRTVQLAEQFWHSHKGHITTTDPNGDWTNPNSASFGIQPLLEPLFAPGALFNSIKAGVACDYPVVHQADSLVTSSINFSGSMTGNRLNYALLYTGLSGISSSNEAGFDSSFSQRVPFEALLNPEVYMAGREYLNQEPHPFGLGRFNFNAKWDGNGDRLYSKMANNFLAEVPEFFLKNQNFTTISSLESSNPEFGNAVAGNYYVMRVKMYRSTDKPNDHYVGWNDVPVRPPQDLYARNGMRETFTMYSRPSAFGIPMWCQGYTVADGFKGQYAIGGTTYYADEPDSMHGFNYPFTPPYYHGEAWCDLIFKATESKKYTVSEIMQSAKRFPYYTRFNWVKGNNVLRDLAGGFYVGEDYKGKYQDYSSSANPWKELIELDVQFKDGDAAGDPSDWNTGAGTWPLIQLYGLRNKYSSAGPTLINYNAMQLDSSLNLFGKAIRRTKQLSTDGTDDRVEVFSEGTQEAKSRWTIQTKFETPMLNFNKYTNLTENNCTKPQFASESVPRGMWHQYGELPKDDEGVFLQVSDIPDSWLRGQLALDYPTVKSKVKSLADLCGFNKEPVRLGDCGAVKQISEAVVAVPFIEKDNIRQFFSIPRSEIDDVVSALNREVEPGVFITGGPPNTGNSVIDMVKKMKRYVMPPSMDFVKYSSINPFAMYIFEFTHNLTTKDLTDIWQNLPPTIGTEAMESEAAISHPLFAEELLGGAAVIEDNKLVPRSTGNDLPSNIQWMIFKAKRRAHTDYFKKVVRDTGTSPKPALLAAYERAEDKDIRALGGDPEISYNWPYDFFSLVELVKIDAEIGFADVESLKEKSKIKPKIAKKVMSRGEFAARGIATARGKGKGKK